VKTRVSVVCLNIKKLMVVILALCLVSNVRATAKEPLYPSNGQENVPVKAELSWERPAGSISFDVYLGTDFDDVNNASSTMPLGVYRGNQEANTHTPGGLELNTTYYWRIDEVNENEPNSLWKGPVWNFTVAEYFVIDDVELYNNSDNKIYDTWLDWFENGTGAVVDLGVYPVDPIRTGARSLLFDYHNSYPGCDNYSEIERGYDSPQDWTIGGAKVLTLYFYGEPNNDTNATEQMYVCLEDGSENAAVVPYVGDANDLKRQEWQEWNVDLRDFTDVNRASVCKVYVGFGDRYNPQPGGAGFVYFDDIRLHGCRSGGLEADITEDCVVDLSDAAVMAEQWLGSGFPLKADLYENCKVDFKDYSLLAGSWLKEQLWAPNDIPSGYKAGLVWVQFHSANFTRPAGTGVDSQVNVDTGTSINDYSRIWLGWLKVPTDAEVTVEAEADDGLRLRIGDECIIDGWHLGGERAGTFISRKGEVLPMRLEYYQNGGEAAFMRLYWRWACRATELIPASAFLHTQSDADWVQGAYDGEVSVHEDKSSIYEPGIEARNPMPIRPGPHLFIGDYLIESSANITRQVNPPRRDPNIPNPIITGLEDKSFQPYLTVLRDFNYGPNPWRIWYGAHTPEFDTGRSNIGYMESADGINWIRPAQILNPFSIQFGCSVIDRGADYPVAAERYKFGYYYSGGLRIGVSADGLSWQPLVYDTVLQANHDITGISWDPLRDCYAATVSFYTTGGKWSGTRRVTLQSFSDDLVHWSMPWYVLTPDDSSDEGQTQFYAMDGFLVRGPLKVGMVKVLRDDLIAEPPVDPSAYGIGYTTLAWTLDGEHWIRDRQCFFDRNHETDPVPWDHAHAWIDEQLIVGDEVYLYYGGYKQGHKVNRFLERQIGLVKMPLDRYVARKAEGPTPGVLVTAPLVMDELCGRLVVNTDAAAGELRVQVREADSNTVIEDMSLTDCVPITADGLRLEVLWGTEEQTLAKLASLANQTIKLEFKLANAKLFAFEFLTP